MARRAGRDDSVRVVGAVRVVRRGHDWSDSRFGGLGLDLIERIDVAGTAAGGAAPTLRVRRPLTAGFVAVLVQSDDGVVAIGLDRGDRDWSVRLPRIPAGARVTLFVVSLATFAELQAELDAVMNRKARVKPRRPGVPMDGIGDVVSGGGAFHDITVTDAAEPPPDLLPEPPAPRRRQGAPAPPPSRRPHRTRAVAPARPPTLAHVDAEMDAQLVQQRETTLTVRLSREQLVPTPGTAHMDAVIPVDENLPVEVTVLPRGLRFAPGVRATRAMRLPLVGTDPARLTFRLIPVDLGRGEVSVVVRQAPVQLPLATLRLSAPIVAAEDADDNPGSLEPRLVDFVDRSTELTDLPSIRVDESIVGGRSTLRIAISIKGQHAEYPAIIGNKASFVERLYRRLGGIREQVAKAPPAEQQQLAKRLVAETGRALAKALFKDEVAALLWRHRKALTGLIVQSSAELDLPWEIVHLRPPEGQVDEVDDGVSHFLADMGLTRWIYDTARPTEIPVRSDRVLAVAPDYEDTLLHLPRAGDEVEALAAHVRATATPVAGPRDLSTRVAAGFDLLHFAGHGRWRDVDPREQQLVLAAFDSDCDDGSAAYGDADARSDFPERAQIDVGDNAPLVFLSACDVGRLRSDAAGLGGFAEAFLRGGAGAFIGCNWAVRDDVAAHFVKSFYTAAFTPGTTIGQATLAARRDARRAGDLSALAFTVFADPRLRLVVHP